jgi:hypothetical protein
MQTKVELLGSSKIPTVEDQNQNRSADPAAAQGMRERATDLASKQPAEKAKSSTNPTKARRGASHASRAPPDDKPRSHHAFRGVPALIPGISLSELADDCLLTELETAALLRLSTHTLEKWRRTGNGRLDWVELPGGLVRYEARKLKEFVLSGTPRGRSRAHKPATSDRVATEAIHPRE